MREVKFFIYKDLRGLNNGVQGGALILKGRL